MAKDAVKRKFDFRLGKLHHTTLSGIEFHSETIDGSVTVTLFVRERDSDAQIQRAVGLAIEKYEAWQVDTEYIPDGWMEPYYESDVAGKWLAAVSRIDESGKQGRIDTISGKLIPKNYRGGHLVTPPQARALLAAHDRLSGDRLKRFESFTIGYAIQVVEDIARTSVLGERTVI